MTALAGLPGNPETCGIDRYSAAYSEIYVILNTLSGVRFAVGGPAGHASDYLPWPPPYTWGTPACIFGPLSFY